MLLAESVKTIGSMIIKAIAKHITTILFVLYIKLNEFKECFRISR